MTPKKQNLMIIFFVFSSFSVIHLLRIAIITGGINSSNLPIRQSQYSNKNNSEVKEEVEILSPKEFRLLSSLIANRAPCNLLCFGVNTQLVNLSKQNSNHGGLSVFLQDEIAETEQKLGHETMKSIQIHQVQYGAKASEAFELLKNARRDTSCYANSSHLVRSKCKLWPKEIPKAVLGTKWDIVVIDGPKGQDAAEPGRMGAIYAAAVLARASAVSDVVVHDTDRMVERWYSWEYLCHENRVSSKGKLWHFSIQGSSRRRSSSTFCPKYKHDFQFQFI